MDWKDEINENVRSGLLELMILHLLSIEDMYGYQIRQELYKRTNGAYDVKEGSLYGPLYRLSAKKMISNRKVLVGEKRFRNYYHIEKAGENYLKYGKEQIDIVFHGVFALFDSREQTAVEDVNNEQDN